MIVDAPPLPPSSEFSPCGGGSSLRKRRSLSSSTTPGNISKFHSFQKVQTFVIIILFFLFHEDPSAAADGCIAKLYVAPLPKTAKEDDVSSLPYLFSFEILFHSLCFIFMSGPSGI